MFLLTYLFASFSEEDGAKIYLFSDLGIFFLIFFNIKMKFFMHI